MLLAAIPALAPSAFSASALADARAPIALDTTLAAIAAAIAAAIVAALAIAAASFATLAITVAFVAAIAIDCLVSALLWQQLAAKQLVHRRRHRVAAATVARRSNACICVPRSPCLLRRCLPHRRRLRTDLCPAGSSHE
jgi:hypothetical protein